MTNFDKLLSESLNSKIFYHCSSFERSHSILKKGLELGHGRFATNLNSVFYNHPDVTGIYLGSLQTALFYGLHIEHPCLFEIDVSLNSIKSLDEATLAYLYTQEHIKPTGIIDKLLELYPSGYELGSGWGPMSKAVINNTERIKQDAVNGELDYFLYNNELIKIAFEMDYPIVVDRVNKDDIIRAWVFYPKTVDIENDLEDEFYNSVGDRKIANPDQKFWKRMK